MTSSTQTPALRPTRAFGLTWLGQVASLIGSGVTHFALGIEIYKRSGSVTQFSLLTFFYLLPMALVSPLAGALVDRWDRRKVMLLSDLGSGLASLCIFGLLHANAAGLWEMKPWHFYGPIVVSALFNAFRWPAFQASTTLMVSKEHLARANGFVELASGVGQLVSPVLAGVLLLKIGLQGIVLMDLATFAFSMVTLLMVRFPKPPVSDEGAAARGSLWKEMGLGWRFIASRPGLRGLLVTLAVVNVVMGMVMVLITPLILSFTDAATLGRVMSASGSGMLVGGIAMGVWGGPKRRIHGVLGFVALAGLPLMLAVLPPSPWLVGLCAALFLFNIPILSSCAQTLWQQKVPPDVQGRVFSVRRVVNLLGAPVASVLAGLLSDAFFEPWMAPDGALAGTLGSIVGTGTGRGIALLFGVLGLVLVAQAIAAWQNPHIRNLEDELPDAESGTDDSPVPSLAS
ncbi:MFS transporter [Pyxidicoccus fallax]|uniref:MFS transporter n=1 Tax=Pyxidicoccus fallax TaxID=394095 RepID=A0A848LD90_9BACT|nr:MFS transporter [Pyxidicoccus fallax]NMO16192.1 MFS transporter [Pyxidicoccus fallax]NPC78896.1 MFS transporter [Pyxidicoccus fallax]